MTDVTKPVTNLLNDQSRRMMANAYLHQIGERGVKNQFPSPVDALDAITFEIGGDPMATWVAFRLGQEMGR